MPAPRKSRSGPNIPESQRRTVRVSLRLPTEAHEALRELAEDSGHTMAELVATMILLDRDSLRAAKRARSRA
jgi:hypothetical protein